MALAKERELRHFINDKRHLSLRLPKFKRSLVGKMPSDFESHEIDPEPEGGASKQSRFGQWFRSLSCKHYAPFSPDNRKGSTSPSDHLVGPSLVAVVDNDCLVSKIEAENDSSIRAPVTSTSDVSGHARQALPKEIVRLRDIKLCNDSESGIGIELRDNAEEAVYTETIISKRGSSC